MPLRQQWWLLLLLLLLAEQCHSGAPAEQVWLPLPQRCCSRTIWAVCGPVAAVTLWALTAATEVQQSASRAVWAPELQQSASRAVLALSTCSRGSAVACSSKASCSSMLRQQQAAQPSIRLQSGSCSLSGHAACSHTSAGYCLQGQACRRAPVCVTPGAYSALPQGL